MRRIRLRNLAEESTRTAQSEGDYTLAGCTVAPGFEFKDFSFLSDMEEARTSLEKDFPDHVGFL